VRILQGIKSFFQFVGDPDTFCLVRLAIENFLNDLIEGRSDAFRVKKLVSTRSKS
jgi:hypothetical protein